MYVCTTEALENKGTTHRVYPLRVLTTASYTQLPLMTEYMASVALDDGVYEPYTPVVNGNKVYESHTHRGQGQQIVDHVCHQVISALYMYVRRSLQ